VRGPDERADHANEHGRRRIAALFPDLVTDLIGSRRPLASA
jgi:hypothetical protein